MDVSLHSYALSIGRLLLTRFLMCETLSLVWLLGLTSSYPHWPPGYFELTNLHLFNSDSMRAFSLATWVF